MLLARKLYHRCPPAPAVTVTEEPSSPTGQQAQPGSGDQKQPASQPDASTQGKSSKSAATLPAPTSPAAPAPVPVPASTNAILSVGGLTLEARDPGTWANTLTVSLSNPDVRDDNDAQSRYGLNKKDLFNLTITEPNSRTTETFRNVTVAPDAQQRVDLVLLTGSNLVFVVGSLPQSVTVPATGTVTTPGKDDGAALTKVDEKSRRNSS
jgi:hypothetical protein